MSASTPTNYEEREYFCYMPSEWAVAAIINYHRCVVCLFEMYHIFLNAPNKQD